ncbi:hypothetical protein LCGC14_1205070, partial [marine sediment metagenome]
MIGIIFLPGRRVLSNIDPLHLVMLF